MVLGGLAGVDAPVSWLVRVRREGDEIVTED
jgi:hypothetical protein